MFTVTATIQAGSRSKTCAQASEAQFWVEDFQDSGAGDIAVERDGVPVPLDDLFRLIFEKTRSCESCRSVNGVSKL